MSCNFSPFSYFIYPSPKDPFCPSLIPIQSCLHPCRIYLNSYIASTIIVDNSTPIVFLPLYTPPYTTCYLSSYPLLCFFLFYNLIIQLLPIYIRTPSKFSIIFIIIIIVIIQQFIVLQKYHHHYYYYRHYQLRYNRNTNNKRYTYN